MKKLSKNLWIPTMEVVMPIYGAGFALKSESFSEETPSCLAILVYICFLVCYCYWYSELVNKSTFVKLFKVSGGKWHCSWGLRAPWRDSINLRRKNVLFNLLLALILLWVCSWIWWIQILLRAAIWTIEHFSLSAWWD